MSEGSKVQPYKYTLKTVAAVDHDFGFGEINSFCLDGAAMYITPPDNAISIENLYCRLRIQFDSSIPSDLRVIKSIGVADEFGNPNGNPTAAFIPNRFKKYDIEAVANASRIVDVRINLTELLKKDNVQYQELFGDWPLTGYTYVNFVLDDALGIGGAEETLTTGTILLWKLDALFTTRGIV